MDYEATIKKLINIIKCNNNNKEPLKEIESLWDTINTTTTTTTTTTTSTTQPSTQIKRTSSDLTQITQHKKQKLITSASTNSFTKSSNNNNNNNKANNNNNNSSLKSSKSSHDMISEEIESVKMDVDVNIVDLDGSNTNSTEKSSFDLMYVDSKHDLSSNIDEYVIEMGLTCDICKLLNQELNNKLAECQECKRMYHQKCHKPMITNDEIHDPRMLWYCSKCKKNVQKILINNNNNNSSSNNKLSTSINTKIEKNTVTTSMSQPSTSQTNINNNNKNSINNTGHSQTANSNSKLNKSIENDSDVSVGSNGHDSQQKSFFKRDPKLQNDSTSNSNIGIIQASPPTPPQLHQSNNSQNKQPFKGLAALATKFNSSTPSHIPTNEALVNKYKSTKTTLSQTKLVNTTSSPPTTTVNSNQQQQQQQQQQKSHPIKAVQK